MHVAIETRVKSKRFSRHKKQITLEVPKMCFFEHVVELGEDVECCEVGFGCGMLLCLGDLYCWVE